MWIQLAAWLAAVILAAVALLQVTLAAGAPMGHLAWGGQSSVLPPKLRLASAVSALVLVAFAWVILIHGQVIERAVPYEWTRIAVGIFAGMFALNTLANLASKSPAEKMVMSPATAILAVCCLALVLFA